MSTYTALTLATPLGPFSVAWNAAEEIVATAFGDLPALRRRLPRATVLRRAGRGGAAVRRQIREYFAGHRREFTLPLAVRGTPFQRRTWAALGRIPCGETRSYGEVAAALGQPRAARAVGRANATNPVCLLVPCHRVIGATGALTGFAFGPDLKRKLLEHERSMDAQPAAA